MFREIIKHHEERKVVVETEDRLIRKSREFRCETIDSYDEQEFIIHFRMQRPTFSKLLQRLQPHLPNAFDGFGEAIIPPIERLYMVIWFLATNETYRALACRFGTSDSVIHESVDMVLNAMSNEFASEDLFPHTDEQCEQVAAKFKRRNGFPNIIGAIDDTHITISKPNYEPDVWIDRKGHHSIAVAAIVDADKKFIYYNIGCPGSMHDQRGYRLSGIHDILQRVQDRFHLVGDSAYTLDTKMMVPYKDNGSLTVRQRSFNFNLSSNRMVVEHAFGLLKNKFHRIHSTLKVSLWKRAAAIIGS